MEEQRPDGVHETGESTIPVTPPVEPEAPAAEPTEPGTPDAPSADPTPADDLAPDADEPGDDLPQDLAGHVHEGDIVPDNVDLAEEQDQA